MTLTLGRLLAASPPAVTELAATWSRLARVLLDRAATVDRVRRQLRGAWSGPAADAAADRLLGLRDELESRYPELLEVEQALREHAETLARAQWLAVAATASAGDTSPGTAPAFAAPPFGGSPSATGGADGTGGTGGTAGGGSGSAGGGWTASPGGAASGGGGTVIDEGGTVGGAPTGDGAGGGVDAGGGVGGGGAGGLGGGGGVGGGVGTGGIGGGGVAGGTPAGGRAGGGAGGGGAVAGSGGGAAGGAAGGAVGAAVGVALELAERSDRETAALLGRVVPVPLDGSRAPDPPAGGSPGAVAAWWSGLAPAQREWLLAARPELVGGLDGVPAGARDAANRVLLRRALARDPGDPGLTAVAARLAAVGPRAYLLGLSTNGRGRAIIALGDPDLAGNVVTYVPGTGSGLVAAGAELDRGDRLLTAARSAGPGQATSVVVWIGYDPPPDVVRAADAGPAVAAGPALRRFQAGLLATHLDGLLHRTVLGWSYGSTVVGLAAADAADGSGAAAPAAPAGGATGAAGAAGGAGDDRLGDDLVLVGSPGVGVAHAADLGVGTGHVWASTAAHDVINAAANPLELARPDLNPLLRPLFGEHTGQEWFGPSPADPAFGGQVFTSDPGDGLHPAATHESYFDPGGRALTAIADIAVGDYADVT